MQKRVKRLVSETTNLNALAALESTGDGGGADRRHSGSADSNAADDNGNDVAVGAAIAILRSDR